MGAKALSKAEAKAANDQMMAVWKDIKEESQNASESLKQRVDHTLDIVTDLRYKADIEKVDATYKVFVDMESFDQLRGKQFDLQVDAENAFEDGKIRNFL